LIFTTGGHSYKVGPESLVLALLQETKMNGNNLLYCHYYIHVVTNYTLCNP